VILLAALSSAAYADETTFFLVVTNEINLRTSETSEGSANLEYTGHPGEQFIYLETTPLGWYKLQTESGKVLFAKLKNNFRAVNLPRQPITIIDKLTAEDRLCQLTVTVEPSFAGKPYYVELIDGDTGLTVFGRFVFAESPYTIDVAEGLYKLRCSTGNVWYGTEERFDGSGFEHTEELKFVITPRGESDNPNQGEATKYTVTIAPIMTKETEPSGEDVEGR
jgi:hypothetical protein